MVHVSNTQSRVPLISFVVIMSNAAQDDLSTCMRSILSLSLRNEEREIIVVDDGSDGYSPFSLGELADEAIFVRMPSGGIETALNFGLRVVSGCFVQFINATDKLLLDGYGHCVDLLRYKSPEIVIFNSTDSNSSAGFYDGDDMEDGAEYLRHNSIDTTPWGYVFDRRIISDLNFQENNIYGYEEFTVMLFLRAERIASTAAVAYSKGGREYAKLNRKDKRFVIKLLDDKYSIICRLSDLSHNMPLEDRLAIERRVAQLTMDYILFIIRYARFSHQLRTRIGKLEQKGLFPLPVKNYDKKYLLFSKIVKNKFLVDIACRILGR